ncbi:hypothetical protein BO82DRAFT_341694 [Aspergillus uvarum CBS 121591]|uniref:Xylanolytic transcriptional activator regulatory domain-containing protein n=1 Tax=Aspergillus uvarum CBS 121591 TaxID=1448315 RepID=A0A319CT47_9EURO|nr:hypothetical protein BO82DRAFT_341694 [Aspergillus uvarum CBS 121591]PYH78788.1 hypothetical protein BO82DRAFT_341694 [Aspergillus uvarum CBS 121591]
MFGITGSSKRARQEDLDEGSPEVEKVACDRCRQRKVRDFEYQHLPDLNIDCLLTDQVRSRSDCTYNRGHKFKEKRQRVLISSVYERRLEYIANKLDHLAEVVGRLSHEHSSHATSAGLRLPLQPSFHQPSQPSSSASTHVEGIESTLFAHVIFTAKCLQAAVMDTHLPYSDVPELTTALNSLWDTITAQTQQNQILECSQPFAELLPRNLTPDLKDLPIPSLDRIMACLRLAHECSSSQLYWPFEFGSLGDFTHYVIRACSPGPITDMELIIVHYVLAWLFAECANLKRGDLLLKQDYEAEALICRQSLETLLGSLSFHVATSLDAVCAMYMATIHCLQHGKPFTAWSFISKASLISQALGLHSPHATMGPAGLEEAEEDEDKIQRKMRLFWAVYVLEKALALRLGRPSTIHDADITLPKLRLDRRMASLLHNRLPDWIEVAGLYGRAYDEICSPKKLAQTAAVRESRIRAVAREWEGVIAARGDLYKHPEQWTSDALAPGLSDFIIHANRATEYSVLASIYRAIPPETEPPSSAPSSGDKGIKPSPESLAAARLSLAETDACITTMLAADADAAPAAWPSSPGFDVWLTENLLVAPVMPFLILLGGLVHSPGSEESDLDILRRIVDGVGRLVRVPRYARCRKYGRVFRVLYDVTAAFVEVRGKRRMDRFVGELGVGVGEGGELGGLGDLDAYLDWSGGGW